jgi:hypothetical protein
MIRIKHASKNNRLVYSPQVKQMCLTYGNQKILHRQEKKMKLIIAPQAVYLPDNGS